MLFGLVKLRARQTVAPVSKGTLLPFQTKISIPAGLDWVVRQRVVHVLALAKKDLSTKAPELNDLVRLNDVLNQDGRKDIDNVTIYGYELSLLYAFLVAQERCFSLWASDLIPPGATGRIRTDLHQLLTYLQTRLHQVDPYADRPAKPLR